MSDDLVKRLRMPSCSAGPIDTEAADRLEHLERENAQLRQQRDAAETELERVNEQLAEIREAWGFRIEN